MRVSGPDFGPHRQWRDAILTGLLLICFSAKPTRAQDVAEAARQQKAKQAGPKVTQHVYTEDDLQRQVILTPEDQARVEARRKQQFTIPGQQYTGNLPSNDQQGESLGEIARRFRLEKAAREAELALKNKFTAFPYEVPAPALAAPAPPIGPLTLPESGGPVVGGSRPLLPNLSPNLPPRPPRVQSRISPFQPRPLNHMSFARASDLVVLRATPVRPTVTHPFEHKVAHVTDLQPSQPLVPPISGKRVQVQPGQSWWKLAKLYLGNGARWAELRQLNPEVGGPPDLLEVGTNLVVPDIQTTPDVANTNLNLGTTVTVQKGDSLWSLARKYLGRGNFWTRLAQANPQIVDFTRLAIGTSVRLPSPEYFNRKETNSQ
jgi:nucleoid-associated protein YgaU